MKPISPWILAPAADGAKAHVDVPHGLKPSIKRFLETLRSKWSGKDNGIHCQRRSTPLPHKVMACVNMPIRANEAGHLEEIITATATGGWKYTHQVKSTRDVLLLHHYEVRNRRKPRYLKILAPEADGAKAHIAVPQGLPLSYLVQWMTCFALGLVVR